MRRVYIGVAVLALAVCAVPFRGTLVRTGMGIARRVNRTLSHTAKTASWRRDRKEGWRRTAMRKMRISGKQNVAEMI